MVTKTRPSLGNIVQVGDRVQADLGPFLKYGNEIILYDGPLKVWVEKDGSYRLLMNSREMAQHYMEKDELRTKQVQEHWQNYDRRTLPKDKPGTLTYLENWINVHPYRSFGKPDVYPEGREDWATGQYESGNSFNFSDDCWLGDAFIFAHFVTLDSEGAVILWHRGGDVRGNYEEPEVWTGDFEGFMAEQNWCDWSTEQGFLTWNDNLGGAMMWALNEMGSFRGDVDLSKTIYEAIKEDPSIAIDPVDIGVLRNERAFPPEVVKAVRDYAESRR